MYVPNICICGIKNTIFIFQDHNNYFKKIDIFISIGYFIVDILTSGFISFLVGAVVFDCDVVEEYSIVCYLKCIF